MNSRHPGPRCVWKGGSDGPGLTPFPLDPADPVAELLLENDPSNFVRRRMGSEPYPSKPSRPPFRFDTLKSRGFVYAKGSFSKKVVISSTRNTHFQNASQMPPRCLQMPPRWLATWGGRGRRLPILLEINIFKMRRAGPGSRPARRILKMLIS